MPTPEGPSRFVSDAYGVAGNEDLVAFYRKWAADYDAEMLGLGYRCHLLLAEMARARLPDTTSAILDVGCGTGLTCTTLHGKGYAKLDGIDLSPDMVRVAAERGIYRDLFVGDVNEPLDRDDDSYDGVVSTGTFTHGHVGPAPLDEIFRILRVGGILACTVHKDLWASMGFDTKFASLVKKGRARCLDRHLDSYYEDREPEGWFCVYEKCGGADMGLRD